MRITKTESPFLESLLPTEMVKSWAMEVEKEEKRERVRKASNWASPTKCICNREARIECREGETWRQWGSVSRRSTSPNRSQKSLQSRHRAYHANHAVAEMSKKSSKSCHNKDRPRQAAEAKEGRLKQWKREEYECVNGSDQARYGYSYRPVRHGYHKRTQYSTDRSEVTRDDYVRELKHRGPLETVVGYSRQMCSRSHKVERKPCHDGGLKNHANSEKYCMVEPQARSDRHGHEKFKGHNLPSAGSNVKLQKEEGRGLSRKGSLNSKEGKVLLGKESGSLKSKDRPQQNEIETRLVSARSSDVGALQMLPFCEKSDTMSSRLEGGSSGFAEEPSKNVQSSSNMELSLDVDVVAKEDACLKTKKEYEMLASLLLDDSLAIDQDFDVTLAASGLGLPDSVYCGSIFGDDLELPAIIMDVEPVLEEISMSGKADMITTVRPVHIEVPHLPAIWGLLEDGTKKTMLKPVYSNDKLVMNHSYSEDNGSISAGASKGLSNLSEARPISRMFVDVTNTFEIENELAVKGKSEEDDAHRLGQRQRQVEFGKNTLGYERYSELVPRCKRKPRDPQTPNPKQVCSKRSWDGQIRKWRRLLHVYDPPHQHGEEEAEDFSIHRSHLQKGANSMREDPNKGFFESNDLMRRDANLTIYDDWE